MALPLFEKRCPIALTSNEAKSVKSASCVMHAFFYEGPLYQDLHAGCHTLKELILLTKKDLRNISISKTFITANDQKFEGWFHSSTAVTHIDTFIKLLFYLNCTFAS